MTIIYLRPRSKANYAIRPSLFDPATEPEINGHSFALIAQSLGRRFHRLALRIGNWMRRRWWETGFARPHVCRVLAVDQYNQVLMVRHSYGAPKWSLPGGGLGRCEVAVDAAIRELSEETGCGLSQARLLACFNERVRRTTVTVSLVGGRLEGCPCADGREILETALYALDALPAESFTGMTDTIRRWLPPLLVELGEH